MKVGEIMALAYTAAFGSVMLPKALYIDNFGVTVLHRLMLVFVLVGMYFLIQMTKGWLDFRIPQGFPTLWAEQDATWATKVTTDMTSGDHCTDATKKFAYYSSEISAPAISCIHPAHFSDGDVNPIRGGEVFLPTYFGESWFERQTQAGACTTLAGSCPGSDYSDDGGNAPCQCASPTLHYWAVGIEEAIVYMEHSMTVDDPQGVQTIGYQSKTKEQALASKTEPMLTVVQHYDPELKAWAEADCSSTATQSQQTGQCRFYGDVVGMRVKQWLELANSEVQLNNINRIAEANEQSTHPDEGTALGAYPIYRMTGGQIIVQMEYLDVNNHTLLDFDDNGSVKAFPGTVCYLKLQFNPQWTVKKRNVFTNVPSAGDLAGKKRVRQFTGLHFVVTNSPESLFGFFSFAALAGFAASAVVYLQLCTSAILVFSIHAIGNTSRNYMRSAREHVNVAIQAARRTPCKLFQAAVSFFFIREWEREPELFDKLLNDPERIQRPTIAKFIRACFNPDIVGELTDQDLENFTDACFYELGGEVNGGICMAEFLECTLAGDVVDYYASKQAFNLKRYKNPLEKIFGDNVKSYHQSKQPKCWGLLPAQGSDPAREKMRSVFNKNGAGAKALGSMGFNSMKMGGDMMGKGFDKVNIFKKKSGKVQPAEAANLAFEEVVPNEHAKVEVDVGNTLNRRTAWKE